MPKTNLNIKYYLEEGQSPIMSKKDFVYSKIGMALISAQRVEFVTGKLVETLQSLIRILRYLRQKSF